jgi:acetyltransferase-like isoleucine patch superfamily enzyme
VNPTARLGTGIVGRRAAKAGRVAWTAVSLLFVEGVVFGLAVSVGVLLMYWSSSWVLGPTWLRLVLFSMTVAPAYVAFAFTLMVLSAAATRVLGWRTPADAEMRIADFDWPLLQWARYLASFHVVRFCAGALFRGTPVWTAYHRLNGARVGRGVYVNSLAVVDDNLLEFGDNVVIGHGAHLSGHTVEHGVVKTGAVRLGRDVMIGVGSVIGIGVEIGAGTQVGALSVVPKHARLEGGAVFAGAPARRIDAPHVSERPTAPGRSPPPTPAVPIPPPGGTPPNPTRAPRPA